MQISLCKCTAVPNKIDKTNYITNVKTYDDCIFKKAEEKRTPDVLVAANYEDIQECNYAWVEGLGYYFIEGMELTRNGLTTVHCRYDALQTWHSAILASPGIIDRAEKGYNLYFDDPYIDVLAYKSVDDMQDFEATDGLRYYGIVIGA